MRIQNSYILVAVALLTLFAAVNCKKDGDKGKKDKNKQYKMRAMKKGKLDVEGFPESLTYVVDVDGEEPMTLQLVRDMSMQMPSTVKKMKNGKTKTKSAKRDSVGFYRDENGNGAFACKVKKRGKKGVVCDMIGMVSFANEDCMLESGTLEATCTERKATGYRKSFVAPDVKSSFELPLFRHKRTAFPGTGRKVVEVAFILDRTFMSPFYQKFPNDNVQAEDEANVYVTLIAVEMNIYFSSLKTVTNGTLDLYVYPATVVIPEAGTDWPHIEQFIFGNKNLNTEGNFDQGLRNFVNSGFTTVQWDHAMTLTGLDLHAADENGQLDSGLLGYAYTKTVCTSSSYRYSINEFTKLDVVLTAVHELGHALGAGHDDSTNCPANTYIMSALAFNVGPSTLDTYHTFSTCSADEMMAHLNSQPECLVNNGFTDEEFQTAFCAGYLGERANSLDLQCQRLTNYSASVACDTIDSDVGCYATNQVRCNTATSNCAARLKFVWNGTPCGADKFCYQGKCQSENQLCANINNAAPTPTTQAPTTQAPTTQAPTTQAPTTQAPTTQAPTTQAPTTQAPTTQAPTTQAPTTQAPTTQAPTTQAPTTQAPTTQAPTTQAPTTQAPTTQAPTTQAPTTQAPATRAPCSCCGYYYFYPYYYYYNCCVNHYYYYGVVCSCC